MKEFIAQRAIRHNGTLYKEGDVLLLNDNHAEALLKNGAVIAYASPKVEVKEVVLLPNYSLIESVIAVKLLTTKQWNELSDAERNALVLEYLTPQQQAEDNEAQGLIGSSKLPSFIDVDGKQVALGDIVAEAFAKSELTISKWNRLSAKARDELLQQHIDTLNKGA